MNRRDRAGDPSGQGAGRREAAGPAGHRRGFPTPAQSATAGSPARPERRLPKAFGQGADGPEFGAGARGWRGPASLRHALLAENLGKPSLWVIIKDLWY